MMNGYKPNAPLWGCHVEEKIRSPMDLEASIGFARMDKARIINGTRRIMLRVRTPIIDLAARSRTTRPSLMETSMSFLDAPPGIAPIIFSMFRLPNETLLPCGEAATQAVELLQFQ